MAEINFDISLLGENKKNFLSRETTMNYFIVQQANDIWSMLCNPQSYMDSEETRNNRLNECISFLQDKEIYKAFTELMLKKTQVKKQVQRFQKYFEKDLMGDKEYYMPSVIAYSLQKNGQFVKCLPEMKKDWDCVIEKYMQESPCQRTKCSFYLEPQKFENYQTLYGIVRGLNENALLKKQFYAKLYYYYPDLNDYVNNYESQNTESGSAHELFTPFISAWVNSYFAGVEDSRINEYLSILYLFAKVKKYNIIDKDIFLLFNIFYNIYGEIGIKKRNRNAAKIRRNIEKAVHDHYDNPILKQMTFTDILVDIFMEDNYKEIRSFCHQIFYQISQLKGSDLDHLMRDYYCFRCLKTRLTEDDYMPDHIFEEELITSVLNIEDYEERVCNEPEKITRAEKRQTLQYLEQWKSFFVFAQQWLNRKNWENQLQKKNKENGYIRQVSRYTDNKENEIEKLKQQLNNIEKRNEDIKSLMSDIADIKKENRRLMQQLEEAGRDQKELIGLRNYIYEENSQYVEKYENIEALATYLDQNIKGIIIGGHPNFHNKLQQYIPKWKKYPPRTKVPTECITGADIIVFYTDHIDHSMYSCVISEARKSSCKLLYIHNVNMESTIKRIYEEFEGTKK